MNEHIKALAVQAGIPLENLPLLVIGYLQTGDEALLAFAELIICDVCKLVNAHMQYNNPHDSLLVLAIKEHYGIV